MTPSIALAYSNGTTTDSWVGFGWSLGLGSIERSTKNGVPAYDDVVDTFVLDGQELIADVAVANRYHTRRESFLRIDRIANGSWEVRAPDGTVSRYGKTANARVGRSATETFTWFLSERVDLHGNAMLVLYDELDPGNRLPAEIRYGLRTGSSGLESLNPGDPDAVDRVIRFVLEARLDRRIHHSARFPQELNRRLREVQVRVGRSLIRRYELTYGVQSQDSGRSLLRGVLEFGADNGALQAPRTTSFTYSSNVTSGRAGWTGVDPDDPQTPAAAFQLPPGLFFTRSDKQDGGTRLAELNGDGLIDVIREVKIGSAAENDALSGAYLNSPSGFRTTPDPNYRLPFVVNYATRQAFHSVWNGVPVSSGLMLTDMNRDGRADVLSMKLFFLLIAPTGNPSAQDLYLNTGAGWATVLSSNNADTLGHPTNSFAFADCLGQATDGGTELGELNGDGRPDLITNDYLTFGTLFAPIVARGYSLALGSTLGFTPRQSDRYTVCTESTDACLLNSVSTRRDIQLAVPALCGAGSTRQVAVIRAGKRHIDVNGDGLDDHVTAFYSFHSGLPQQDFKNVYINDGTDYISDDRWVVPVDFDVEDPNGALSRDQGVRVADLNGDGIVDLVRAFGATRGVWLGTGNPLTPWIAEAPSSSWQVPAGLEFVNSSGQDTGVRLADLSGDGMADLLKAAEGSTQQVMFNRGLVPDQLVQVTNPHGGTTLFEYLPSTSAQFGSSNASGSPALAQVRQVVSAVEVSDGRTPAYSPPVRTTFRYQGGVFDADDRELRGFRVVTAVQSGRTTVTQFHQDDARAGLVEWSERRDGGGGVWHRVENSYTPDAVAPFVTLLERTISLEYDGQSTPRRTRTDYQYDSFGNPIATFAHGEVDAAGNDPPPPAVDDNRSTVLEYAPPNAGLYLVNLASRSTLRAGGPSSSSIVRESQFYYDGDTTGTAVPTVGNLTRRVEVLAEAGKQDPTTRFTYDAFGNVQTVVDPRENAVELAVSAGTTTYTYDSTFHTFLTAVENSLGHRTEYQYSSASCAVAPLVDYPAGGGLVQVELRPSDIAFGNGWLRCYDAFGRIGLERAPASLAESTWAYVDTPGQVSIARSDLTETGSRVTLTELDGLGRVVRTTAPGSLGRDVLQVRNYDSSGRLLSETSPYFTGGSQQSSSFVYDALDRVTRTDLPGNRARTAQYDRGLVTLKSLANPAAPNDPNNRIIERHIDGFGNVDWVREHNGAASYTTSYGYDVSGALTAVADHFGNVTTIAPDRLGRKVTLVDPDTGTTSYTYDANGNLRTRTDGLGTATWTYDQLNRPATRTAPGELVASWTYDTAGNGKGRLRQRADAAGVYTVVGYDRLGRATSETQAVDGRAFAFGNSFTRLGAVNTRQYPTGRTLQWNYDARGFLTELRDQAGLAYATAAEWDARGRLVRWTASSGVRSETNYDTTTGRLQSLKVGSNLASPTLQNLAYQPNSLDLITGITDQLDSARSQTFGYDKLSRLEQASGPYGARYYSYSPLGNLLCKDATQPAASDPNCTSGKKLVYPTPGPGAVRPHAPLGVDGLTAGYGSTGNLQSLGARIYTYSPLGELAMATEGGIPLAEMTYDASGRRSKVIDRTQNPVGVRHLVTGDFEWDQTNKLATINVSLGGSLIATRLERYTAQAGAMFAVPIGREGAWGVALAPGLVAGLLLGLHLLYLRQRRAPLARPALAGSMAIVVYLGVVTPVLAQIPDGDMNQDDRLDAGDALLMTRIVEGSLPETSTYQARGDIAPLELAPETPSDLNAGDLVLLLRAVSGEDVDGDGVPANAELEAGASPFRKDTDRDGVTDDVEILRGSDPSQGDTDQDGFGDATDTDAVRGVVFWYGDQLGSTTLRTKSDGVLLERVVYRPYGETIQVAGGAATPPEFGYTGQRFEKSVGIYDYGARWYDPALGRFLQPDSIVPSPTSPQSLNRYSYVLNNPISRIDPSGMTSFTFGLGVGSLSYSSGVGFGWNWGPSLGGSFDTGSSGFGSGAFGFSAGVGLGGAGFSGGIGFQTQGHAFGAGLGVGSSGGTLQLGGGTISLGAGRNFALGAAPGLNQPAQANPASGPPQVLPSSFIGPLQPGTVRDQSEPGHIESLAGKLWTSPNTALGLGIGLLGVPFGADAQFGNNAVEFLDYPLGPGGALTLGNSIIYRGSRPESFDRIYGVAQWVGRHERAHTYQAEVLGPLYLPAYFLGGRAISRDNIYERAASDFSSYQGSWWPE